jgi:hypothetical protein
VHRAQSGEEAGGEHGSELWCPGESVQMAGKRFLIKNKRRRATVLVEMLLGLHSSLPRT